MKKFLLLAACIFTVSALGIAGCNESKNRNAENYDIGKTYYSVQEEQPNGDCDDGNCNDESINDPDDNDGENELPNPPDCPPRKHCKPRRGHRRSPKPCPMPKGNPEQAKNLRL